MNWMTSGRHRALRSTRGKQRRERAFPAHVQQQAARCAMVPTRRREESGGDASATAWYIRPIRDENESHDIQMLELAREAATGETQVREEEVEMSAEAAPCVTTPEKSTTAKEEKPKPVVGRRCVFTPVKSKRGAGVSDPRPKKKAASPLPRDMLFFNEGEQVSKPVGQLLTTARVKTGESKLDISSWTDDSLALKSRSESEPFYASSSSSDDHDQTHERDQANESRFSPLWAKLDTTSQHHHLFTKPGMLENLESTLCGERIDGHIISSSDHDALNGPTTSPMMDDEQPILVSTHHERGMKSFFLPDQLPPEKALSHVGFEDQLFSPRFSSPYAASDIPEALRLIKVEYESPNSDSELAIYDSRSERLLPHKTSSPSVQSQDSNSSRDSFTMPPPMNWQKNLRTHRDDCDGRVDAPDILRATSSDRDDTHCREVEQSERSHHDACGPRSSPKWSCCSRTRVILDKIHYLESDKVEKHADSMGKMRQKLREERAMTLYLYVLIRCHQINESCHNPVSDGRSDANNVAA